MKKRKSKKSQINGMLSERLKILEIESQGIPSFVLTHLREKVDAATEKAKKDLESATAALKEDNEERLRAEIARIVTHQSVARAFERIPTKRGEDEGNSSVAERAPSGDATEITA